MDVATVASLFLWSLVSAHVASDRQGRAPQSELESVVKDILTRPSATEEPESTRHPICGVEYDCVDPGDCDQYGNIFSSDLLDRTKLLKVPKQMPGSGFFHGGLLDNPREVRCELRDGGQGVCCRKARLKTCPQSQTCELGWFCAGHDQEQHYRSLAEHPRQCVFSSTVYNRVSICCPGAPNAENFPPVLQTCGVRNFNGVNPVDSFNDPLLLIDEKNFKASVTHFGEFPWQAMIFFEKGPLSYNFLCGGVLISTRHVLTAAHNVNGYDVKKLHVRLGEWKVNEDKEALPVQDFLVESVVQHPLFRIRGLFHDIAILVLNKEVHIVNNAHMACLPLENENFFGTNCISTGWGAQSFKGSLETTLKVVALPIWNFDDCQTALRKTKLGSNFSLHPSFICAGGEGPDTCTGDGGGPLVCEIDGHYVVVGITSWGVDCGVVGVPGVYAGTAPALSWVNLILGKADHTLYPRKTYFRGKGDPKNMLAVIERPKIVLTTTAIPFLRGNYEPFGQ